MLPDDYTILSVKLGLESRISTCSVGRRRSLDVHGFIETFRNRLFESDRTRGPDRNGEENNELRPDPVTRYHEWWGMNMRPTGLHVRTLMILIALLAIALAAWVLFPPWWQYHQSIKTLSG
jgi:hypothetical protein